MELQCLEIALGVTKQPKWLGHLRKYKQEGEYGVAVHRVTISILIVSVTAST